MSDWTSLVDAWSGSDRLALTGDDESLTSRAWSARGHMYGSTGTTTAFTCHRFDDPPPVVAALRILRA